jgi:transposase InsO family protein
LKQLEQENDRRRMAVADLTLKKLTPEETSERRTPLGTVQHVTAAITGLARQYGRYGYRRITALLRAEGWCRNHKRGKRIWRRGGLRYLPDSPNADGSG